MAGPSRSRPYFKRTLVIINEVFIALFDKEAPHSGLPLLMWDKIKAVSDSKDLMLIHLSPESSL